MALNTKENREILIGIYPDLRTDQNFEILSAPSHKYNCIAWAMHCDDRWADVESAPGHWWPDDVATDLAPQSLVDAFFAVGFEVADNDMVEEGYDKVALFKAYNNMLSCVIWTHAARVVAPGVLHSKFGDSFDGKHSPATVKNVPSWRQNDSYGEVFMYMKRKIHMEMQSLVEGSASIDMSKLSL